MKKNTNEIYENILCFVIFTIIGLISPFLWIFHNPSFISIKILITSFDIFFLPSYLIFKTRNHYEMQLLEEIISSIILNLCIWTITGILFIQFEWKLSIYNIILVFYLYIVLLASIYINKIIAKSKKNETPLNIIIAFEFNKIRKIFSKRVSNFTLLIIFLLILSVFVSINIPFVPYEDVWYHLSIVKDFVDDGELISYAIYRGNITYHFLGAIYSICSGIDILSMGKYVGILQIPIGCLIFYVLMSKFVKNKQIVIITTIIFSLTSLGTILNFSQFWPQAHAIFFGSQLIINFLNNMEQTGLLNSDEILNVKMHPFKKYILQNGKYLIFQTILIISSMVVHVSSLTIYLILVLISLLFISYRNRQYSFEFIFYLIALVLNSFLNPYSFEILGIFSNLTLIITILTIIMAVLILPFGFFMVEKFMHKYTFNIKQPTREWFDPSNSSFWVEKHIFWKVIIPCISFISPLIYYFMNIQTKKYFPADVWIILLESVFIAVLLAISIMGILFYRQYSLVGKIIFMFLITIIGLLIIFAVFGIIYTVIIRTFRLIVPYIFVGIGLYLLYHEKRWLKTNKHKQILSIFLLGNLFVGIAYQATFSDYVTPAEINFVSNSSKFSKPTDLLSNNMSSNSTILMFGSFHFDYPYEYYANRSNLQYIPAYSQYIHPANQTITFGNGTSINTLQLLLSDTDYDNILIFLDQSYLDQGINLLDGRNYGKMTLNEFNQYNNLNYLNRIAVASNRKSIFCVILN